MSTVHYLPWAGTLGTHSTHAGGLKTQGHEDTQVRHTLCLVQSLAHKKCPWEAGQTLTLFPEAIDLDTRAGGTWSHRLQAPAPEPSE